MIKMTLTVELTEEELREIGNYLTRVYPPVKDKAKHSQRWLHRKLMQEELRSTARVRIDRLKWNAAEHRKEN
jgi:hypothetical protein